MLPAWAMSLPWPLIQEKSLSYGLDPLLVAAIVMKESGGNPYAIRYEPTYRYAWEERAFSEKINSSVETERLGQMTSWGLLQVMGGVARELGFSGWFPELSDEALGLEYGCKHLKRKLTQYPLWDAVSAYNQGDNRKTEGGLPQNFRYVDQVHAFYTELQALPPPERARP